MIVSTEFFEIGSNLKIGAAMEARNDLVFDALTRELSAVVDADYWGVTPT